jgi:hypothetical protein
LVTAGLLQKVVEGKIVGRIDVRGGRVRRYTQLLNDLKENTGFWIWKEEALDHTV